MGADINAVDKEGRTPLHDAARAGSASVVDLLLDRGAIVAVVDKNGRTPLHDAIRTRVSDIVCVIVSHIAGTQYANQLQLRSQRFISDYPLFGSAYEGCVSVVSIWVLPWNGEEIYRSCDSDIGNILTISRIEPRSDRFIARTVSEYLVEVYPTFGPGLLQWITQICSSSARRASPQSIETNEARSCSLQQAPSGAILDPFNDAKHTVLVKGLLDAQNLVVTVSTFPETPIQNVKAALVWILAVLQNPKRKNGISHLLLDQNSLDEGIPSPVAFEHQDSQNYCWLELFDSVTIMDITLPTVPPIDSISEGLEIRPDILIELAKVDREDRIFGEVPILYGFDTALVPLEPGEGRRWHLLVTEGRQITPQRAEKELIKLGLDGKLLKGTIGDGNVYVGWCPNFLVSIYSDSMKVYKDCIAKSSGVLPSGRVEEQSERSRGRDISFPLRIGWPGSSFGISPGAKWEKKYKTTIVIAPRKRESNFDRVLSEASNIPSILWDNDEKIAWLFPVVSVLAFASLRYIESMRYGFKTQDGRGAGVYYLNYGSMDERNTAEEAENILRQNGPLIADTVKGFKVNEPMTFEALVRDIWEKMCDGEDLCIDEMTGLNRHDDRGIFGYDLSEATSGTRPQLRKLHYLPSMKKWSPLLQVRRVQVIFSHHVGTSLSCSCSPSHLQPTTQGALTCVLADLRRFYGEGWKTVATNLDLTGLPIGEDFEWIPVRRNGVDSHQEMQAITEKMHKRLKKRSVNGPMTNSQRIQWERYQLHRQYLVSFG
ncbi:hypothetical protein BU24DRAFT_100211 [Aaosphaeria arxii CBS 175.79]|uniref:Uncharacterized protein n=1 Tax=Aaosphaeria arxii CBS 175.79 TaxID=1450172 RepID=A0A6A5Y202_9PLEO|nr:uncharacterized protein BU24DRAFT_100211 [Aaosphaeria arxii CBS 175.79]KAF2018584.1 hypothetical protein BU24DRAFT_100211 [Aaosphaeria arxii CBS 175.79]